ncbi:MAG: SRPBCC family protein [Candidatus Dormibacteraeota bacterium]|nr:SRPBCC family protein [Candidatus Dormibacteraeota bacterium]
MNEFDMVTVINRPANKVFAYLVDFEKASLWNRNLREARKTSEGPLGVGSTILFVGKFLGRPIGSVAECTDFVANERFATKPISGPFYLEVDHRLQEVDGGTRLATVYRGESRGFFKLAESVIVRATRKQFETAAENLKTLMEAGPPQGRPRRALLRRHPARTPPTRLN